MSIWLFFALVLITVLPPWLAFNCHFVAPPTSPSARDSLSSAIDLPLDLNPPSSSSSSSSSIDRIASKPKKTTITRETSRYRGTPTYAHIRDVEMVVTSAKYFYHRDLSNKEITVGGGIVEQPARVDRAGNVKGPIIKKTKAQLVCNDRINDTVVPLYIWQSDNLGNLHEGMFSLYTILKETNLLDKPFRLGFLDTYGPNNMDVIKSVFPKMLDSHLQISNLKEQHPVDMMAFTPPEIIDGVCVRELLIMKDQFPVFGPARPRALMNYRRYLFDVFGLGKPSESAVDHKFDIPDKAVVRSSPSTGKPRVVLLQRRRYRLILNSEQLVNDLAQALGDSAEIVEVAMHQLSTMDQIRLMQSTTVLIGAHGAELAQLWFLPRTSSMIVLHPPGADKLLAPASFSSGAPWLVDYESVAAKLKLNTYQHKITKSAESNTLDDCGDLQSRWDLYCAYVKDLEVDSAELIPIVQSALDAAAARRKDEAS